MRPLPRGRRSESKRYGLKTLFRSFLSPARSRCPISPPLTSRFMSGLYPNGSRSAASWRWLMLLGWVVGFFLSDAQPGIIHRWTQVNTDIGTRVAITDLRAFAFIGGLYLALSVAYSLM